MDDGAGQFQSGVSPDAAVASSRRRPGVRHNAALALVRFGDGAGRAELVAMLKPYSLKAETAGVAEAIIEEEGIAVAHGSPLMRIKQDDGQTVEMRAPEDGRVETVIATDGTFIQPGDELVVLSPSVAQVENVLVALALVGTAGRRGGYRALHPADSGHARSHTRDGSPRDTRDKPPRRSARARVID